MPASSGNERGHNNKGANPDKVAEFAANNYAELRRRFNRHGGADRRIPFDPLADARRRETNPQTRTPNQEQ